MLFYVKSFGFVKLNFCHLYLFWSPKLILNDYIKFIYRVYIFKSIGIPN